MATITVYDVVDDSDGDIMHTSLSRDKAYAWVVGKRDKGSSLPLDIREKVRRDVEEPIAALAIHLDVDPESIEETRHSSDTYECEDEPGEYRVLTESERETATDESLESYIDECIFGQLSAKEHGSIVETLERYFDRAAWKRDALMSDGYGHTLSPYDGQEHEVKVGDTWYYIYRVN